MHERISDQRGTLWARANHMVHRGIAGAPGPVRANDANARLRRLIGNQASPRLLWPHGADLAPSATARSMSDYNGARNAEDLDAPEPDDTMRRSEGDAGPADAGAPDAGAVDAGTPSLSASLSITGDGSYADTASESRKNVRFNVTWTGGSKEDYVIVNWLKGYLKKPDGTAFKVTMYGTSVDFNFASHQVDSLDADPAYWSQGGVRWRYTVDAANKFSATDSPGPMYDTDGAGAKARVDFKTAVYKSSDVPATTSGSISATPLSSFETWTYHVNVLGGGKFNHT